MYGVMYLHPFVLLVIVLRVVNEIIYEFICFINEYMIDYRYRAILPDWRLVLCGTFLLHSAVRMLFGVQACQRQK